MEVCVLQEKEWQIQNLLYSVLAQHIEKPHPLLNSLCFRLCCLVFLLYKVEDVTGLNRIERKFEAFAKMFQEFREKEEEEEDNDNASK